MNGWREAILAVGAGALLGVPAASAQDALPPVALPGVDTREALIELLDLRAEANEAAIEAQKRIDEISDETDDLLARYRTTLKQIEAIQRHNRQVSGLIASQEGQLAELGERLDEVDLVGRSVTPFMLRMIDTIETFVSLDVPFLLDERRERIVTLRRLMDRADVSNSEKYRQIMEAYQIENDYGRTIEAYRSTLLDGDRRLTVDFLRFGRIALVYQTLDESERGVWDNESRSWKRLDDSHRGAIRHGLQIARRQVVPDLIRLPLPAPEEAGEAS